MLTSKNFLGLPALPQGRTLSSEEISSAAIALAAKVKEIVGCDGVLVCEFNLILPNQGPRIIADASKDRWNEIINKEFVGRHLRSLSQQIYASVDMSKDNSPYHEELSSLGIGSVLSGCIEVNNLEWGALICWNKNSCEWEESNLLLILQTCQYLEYAIARSMLKSVFVDRGHTKTISKIKSLLNTPSDWKTFQVLVKASLQSLRQLFQASNCSILVGNECLFTLTEDRLSVTRTPYYQDIVTKDLVVVPIFINSIHWGFIEIESPYLPWDEVESTFLRKAGFIICSAIANKESDYLQAYYLDRIIETAPIVLYKLDKLGICTFCLGNNLVDYQIFHKELLGKNIFEENAGYPKNQQFFKEAFELSTHSGFVSANGTIFHNHTVLLENGEIIGVAIDYTEQFTFQKDLETVVYSLSHDLQEPLRAISNNHKLLENRLTAIGVQDDEISNRLKKGSSSVKKLSELIEEQLQLSRINSTKKPFEQNDSKSIIQEAIDNLSDLITRKNAQIEFVTPFFPTISCDRSQMVSLFQNLIGNAIKFNNLTEPPSVWISCNLEGTRFWKYGIADNGIGIDPQYQKQIFEIWKRLHSESDFPGTGMGLAICRKIINRHKGNIWVESEGDGTGSIFYFTIPASTEGLLFSAI
jgi:signal transduction histidine kinase